MALPLHCERLSLGLYLLPWPRPFLNRALTVTPGRVEVFVSCVIHGQAANKPESAFLYYITVFYCTVQYYTVLLSCECCDGKGDKTLRALKLVFSNFWQGYIYISKSIGISRHFRLFSPLKKIPGREQQLCILARIYFNFVNIYRYCKIKLK